MGFTPKGKVYVLEFEGDSELDGLVVKAKSAPVSTMLALGELAEGIGVSEAATPEEALAQIALMRPLLEAYAAVLVEWNLEDEHGAPVPATFDGLTTLDPGQVMRIIGAWQRAVSDVPAPLPQRSSDGAPSEGLSMPMEPLSPSRVA